MGRGAIGRTGTSGGGMPRIAVLPGAVADQIAAGEVVERPASVVKELFENSLDAGATTIEVTVIQGGRTLVRVSDDGCGMDTRDALLSLARHGTSKISSSDDLTRIHTFGFRGEALPAICSVSQLEIETAVMDGAGTRVRSAGGEHATVSETQRRRGTTVSVANLFYNVPARAKFLRGPRSEWRAIADVLTSLALTRRNVRMEVTHDGRRALRTPVASSLRGRLAALWGGEYAAGLLEVDDVSGSIHVSGLIERPALAGLSARRNFMSVNGRAVRDAALTRAAELAYRSTLPSGVRPSLFLEIVVPLDSVDVNVHPAKAEVRFADRWSVERALERAVADALGRFDSAGSLGRSFFTTGLDSAPHQSEASAGEAADLVDLAALQVGSIPPLFAAAATAADDPAGAAGSGAELAGLSAARLAPIAAGELHAPQHVPALVQLRRTYIMLERELGVVLVDQHSAHERVLYEMFMRNLERGGVPSQRLLLPLTLSLTTAEAEVLEHQREYFGRLGFEIEQFGGNSIIVHSVPAPHARFDAGRCLRETLSALSGDRASGRVSGHEHLVATLACKAAIRSGEPLGQDEMRSLFTALRETRLPAHDVHGRATVVQLSWDEVDRRFGRS